MEHSGELVRTNSPNFVCTILPSHWRCNKILLFPFKVLSLGDVLDPTVEMINSGVSLYFSCVTVFSASNLTVNRVQAMVYTSLMQQDSGGWLAQPRPGYWQLNEKNWYQTALR